MAIPAYGAVTVTTAATSILAGNPQRRGCLITNNGSATIYLGFDASLTTSNGLPLPASATFNNSDDSALYRGPIYGIIGSSTADVRYWEWVA